MTIPISVEHVYKRYRHKQMLQDLSLELTTGVYACWAPMAPGNRRRPTDRLVVAAR
ncbi:MAG: hypothetical protein IMW91_08935 [Firmicutes bacterium]|nr:hypothetical protein [Bacillota bacterium]